MRAANTLTRADTFRHTKNACDARGGNQINDKCHILYEWASEWVCTCFVSSVLSTPVGEWRQRRRWQRRRRRTEKVKWMKRPNERKDWSLKLQLCTDIILFLRFAPVYLCCFATNEWLYLFALEHARHTEKKSNSNNSARQYEEYTLKAFYQIIFL